MPDISKIRLPGSNTDYDIKDAVAREAIAGGVTFIIAWDGTSTPVEADIPDGVVVYYNGTSYTGELSAETSGTGTHAQPGAFYLVKSNTQVAVLDTYDEYVPVGTTGSKNWEKLGDTQIDLSDVVTNVALNKSTDKVLGEATTFANSTSSVSFSGGTTDVVLGEATTFTSSTPTITVTPSTTYIKGTASGTAVGANGTATPITGYPDVTTDTFVKSVSAETGKNLVTTTITGTNGTESVSKVTKTASKLVTTSVPNVTSAGSASTWSFAMGTGSASETLIISGGNSVAPTLGTAITAATGAVASNGAGSDVVTAVTISDKTVAKVAASATTVATGATSTTGTGDAVVTGVTIGSSGTALTGLGTPTTATVLTGVKVTTQPTITLATDSSSGTGKVQVATGISSATSTQPTITVGTNDKVTAITGLGTGTAAAQTITVGTNDKVTTLTDGTSLTVTKGNA